MLTISNLFILLLYSIRINALTHIELANALSKFLHHKIQPTKLNLLLGCWKNEDINSFVRVLSNNGISAGFIAPQYNKSVVAKELEMFIMDFDCYTIDDRLTDNEQFLYFPHRWFVFINNITTFPTDVPLNMNSRLYLFPKLMPHILTSPYRVLNKTRYKFDAIGTWYNNTYITPLKHLLDYRDRVDLNGLIVNATAVMVFPRTLEHMQDWRHLGEDPITKHNFLLLHHLMDIMNATLRLAFEPGWGVRAPNSSQYNFMIGDIQDGRADIAGTIAFITKDRLVFADFVASPIPTLGMFIFKAPPLSVVNNILTMPFEARIWVSIALLLVVIFALMLLTIQWEWRLLGFAETVEAQVLRPTSMDVVQLQIGAVCQQGTEAEPKTLSGRIITFCTFLSFLFIYTAYSACIVALLKSTSNSIQTLDDLLNTKIELAADNMPYSRYFFSIQTGATKEAIYRQKIAPVNKPGNFLPAAVGVEKMRTEFFGFHAERDQIYKEIKRTYKEHEKCGLSEIKYLSEIEPYMLVRKRLPYKEIVTIAYSKFKEVGLSNRLFKLTYAEKPKCTGAGANFRSVSLTDAYFAVVTYSIGASLSVIIYLFERIIHISKLRRS